MSKACQKHTKQKHHHGHVHFSIVLGVIFVLFAVMFQLFSVGFSTYQNMAELYGRITSLEDDVLVLTEENYYLWNEMEARDFLINTEEDKEGIADLDEVE